MLNGHNPQDPLHVARSQYGKQLFQALSQVCNGFSAQDVINASVNVLVAALRTGYATRKEAEAAYDEIAGKTKQLLLDHYDSVTGKRRSIFPFNQTITPETLIKDDKLKR